MSTYNASKLGKLFISKSSEKSELTPGGKLTKANNSMCIALGQAIAEAHNNWQSSVMVNNVLVSGGVASPGGSLTGGIGTGILGCISGRIKSFSGQTKGKFPTNSMSSLTPATKSLAIAISDAFMEVYNQFLDLAMLTNIQVSGGSCSCKIVSGAPVPGSYSDGIGKLSSLSGNISGKVSASQIKSKIISKLNSSIVAKGSPTKALMSQLNAISLAIEEYNTEWLGKTKMQNLKVSGGITIPYSPIIMAIGKSGKFV